MMNEDTFVDIESAGDTSPPGTPSKTRSLFSAEAMVTSTSNGFKFTISSDRRKSLLPKANTNLHAIMGQKNSYGLGYYDKATIYDTNSQVMVAVVELFKPDDNTIVCKISDYQDGRVNDPQVIAVIIDDETYIQDESNLVMKLLSKLSSKINILSKLGIGRKLVDSESHFMYVVPNNSGDATPNKLVNIVADLFPNPIYMDIVQINGFIGHAMALDINDPNTISYSNVENNQPLVRLSKIDNSKLWGAKSKIEFGRLDNVQAFGNILSTIMIDDCKSARPRNKIIAIIECIIHCILSLNFYTFLFLSNYYGTPPYFEFFKYLGKEWRGSKKN